MVSLDFTIIPESLSDDLSSTIFLLKSLNRFPYIDLLEELGAINETYWQSKGKLKESWKVAEISIIFFFFLRKNNIISLNILIVAQDSGKF